MNTLCVDNEGQLAQQVRRLHGERVAVVRASLLLFFFFRACAVRGRSMRTWHHIPSTTWVIMPKSITSSLIPEFFIFQARPWLVPCGTESWLARTPWVLGFSPVGGNRLYSEGEPVQVLSRKGKEDCSKLLTVLAVILKGGLPTRPLRGFLATRSGEDRFSSRKVCTRANGPPDGGDSTAREHQTKPLVSSTQKSHPPLPRGWITGAKCSREPTVEREGGRREQIKSQKRKNRKEERKAAKLIYSNLEY